MFAANQFIMHVVLDLEVRYSDKIQRLSTLETEVLKSIIEFVELRIRILEDEIIYEESILDKPKFVLINLTDGRIEAREYSQELCDKIINCFSPNDINWMWLGVETIIQKLKN